MLSLDTIDIEIKNILEHGNNRADISCLADLYICREAMREKPEPMAERIKAEGSEFASCINGKCFSEILPFLEELLETIQVIQPKLYDAFLRKIKS